MQIGGTYKLKRQNWDLNPDWHHSYGHKSDEDGLNGIIDAAVNTAGSLAKMLIGVFKRPPADLWSLWNIDERKEYVREALQISTTSAITGKTLSATEIFQKLIARVDTNDSWYQWKKKNSSFLPAIWQADAEAAQYKKYGYQPNMVYVNPEMLKRASQPATAGFPITSIGGIILIGALAYMAYQNYEKAKSRTLNSHKKSQS